MALSCWTSFQVHMRQIELQLHLLFYSISVAHPTQAHTSKWYQTIANGLNFRKYSNYRQEDFPTSPTLELLLLETSLPLPLHPGLP